MMRRGKFILTALAFYPFSTIAKIATTIMTRTYKGFKVNDGEARFGVDYKMKGVTLNVLDMKIFGPTLKAT